MAYTVLFTSQGERSVKALDRSVAARIKPKVLALGENPRPSGAVKLHGHPDLYRIRVGDYRIVYSVNDRRGVVEITIVAHRREVYRDF